MARAEEYSRDRTNSPPSWVEIACGRIVVKFVKNGPGVKSSGRFVLDGGRAHTSTYIHKVDFGDCLRMAQEIIHPRRNIPPPHWMDSREED